MLWDLYSFLPQPASIISLRFLRPSGSDAPLDLLLYFWIMLLISGAPGCPVQKINHWLPGLHRFFFIHIIFLRIANSTVGLRLSPRTKGELFSGGMNVVWICRLKFHTIEKDVKKRKVHGGGISLCIDIFWDGKMNLRILNFTDQADRRYCI